MRNISESLVLGRCHRARRSPASYAIHSLARVDGKLQPWQQDTFVVRWEDRSLDSDAYVTFGLKPDGTVNQVRMKPVSPLTDFSFDFQDLVLKPVAKDAEPY